jgi:hypothetical protein
VIAAVKVPRMRDRINQNDRRQRSGVERRTWLNGAPSPNCLARR